MLVPFYTRIYIVIPCYVVLTYTNERLCISKFTLPAKEMSLLNLYTMKRKCNLFSFVSCSVSRQGSLELILSQINLLIGKKSGR